MNIIDERDRRTIYRKAKKKQYDELMTLSTENEKWVRLLDEGMVTYGDGTPWFYLAKGTLKSYLENLSPEYVGSINIGHTDLATNPDAIVGQWTKDDLRLVDIGDGRQALDVRLNVWENHPRIQAIKMSPYDVGVSAEFFTHVNEDLTNNKDLNPYGVDIVDGVNITDFAIVGDAGNVNSMGIRLKGGAMDFKGIELALQNEGGNVFEKTAEALEELLDEEVTEEVTDPEEEAEEVAEEVAEETEEVTEETEEVSEEEVEDEMTSLTAVFEELRKENESLKAENAALKANLSAKTTQIKEIVGNFKNLSVALTDTKPVVETKVQYTDGIGE